MKIYKSLLKGVSDTQFEQNTFGVVAFISYGRLAEEGFNVRIREDEEIVGMVMDERGISIYLKTKD